MNEARILGDSGHTDDPIHAAAFRATCDYHSCLGKRADKLGFQKHHSMALQQTSGRVSLNSKESLSLIDCIGAEEGTWNSTPLRKLAAGPDEIGPEEGNTGTGLAPIGGHWASYYNAGSRRTSSPLGAPRGITASSARFHPALVCALAPPH